MTTTDKGNILKKGILITFEGVEGCGKSTQARKLYHYLRKCGYTVVFTREPGGTPIGNKIRRILLDPANRKMGGYSELFLYLASRAQHVEELIKPALDKGCIVISDRFTDASIAYQSAGRKIDANLINRLNVIACDGIKPDLTIVIDVSPRTGLKRTCKRLKTTGKKVDRIESETLKFHQQVRNEYRKIAQSQPKRVKIIDGEGTISEVTARVIKIVTIFIEDKLHSQSTVQ